MSVDTVQRPPELDLSKVTASTLRRIPFELGSGSDQPGISSVTIRELRVRLDGRGDLIELWSRPWVSADGSGVMDTAHVYQSATDQGVVKAWHLHAVHTDQFTCTRGKLQVVLADVREDSPTYGYVDSLIIGERRPAMIKIPPGVLHGWKALSAPEVIVVNFQTHPYDANDELKFPWDCILTDVWQPKNG